MEKILIIPTLNELNKNLELSEEYSAGFEFNDFFMPEVLDSEESQNRIISEYMSRKIPSLRTIHGAFFDVSVFSADRRIREVSDLRVRQSISAARKTGAKGVVFHTNYNPFLNTSDYVKGWVDSNAAYWSGILSEDPGMEIYIENMFDRSPDVLAELSEQLCSFRNYGVCFDYAHAALTEVPQREWAEKLGKYIKHVHINDNNFDSDSHLAWGDGKIDRSEFYRLYEKYMNSATVLVEVSGYERQKKSLDMLKREGFIS